MSNMQSGNSWQKPWRAVRRRWKVVFISTLVGIAGALYLGSISPQEPAPLWLDPLVQWLASSGISSTQAIWLLSAIGLIFGITLAGIVDWLDPSLKDAADVLQELGLPLIGTAPQGVVTPRRIESKLSEAYRIIRNSIDVSDSTLRSLCVLSAAPKEGAAAATMSLACVWAEQGMRVLVVDTDLAGGASLRDGNRPGLSDFIAASASLEEIVSESSIPEVSMIPAGSAGGSIASHHIRALLNWASERYDLVLLYASPMLISSDTMIVARQADACVMAVRRGRLAVRTLRLALTLLASTRPALLGIILTGVSRGPRVTAHTELPNYTNYRSARRHTLESRVRQNRKVA